MPMRRTKLVVLSMLLLNCSAYLSPSSVSAYPRITAMAALVMDVQTGTILYEQNAHVPLPMASTTKIMTALIGLEQLQPNTLLRLSSYAASMSPSKIYLKSGEQIRAGDLLQAILVSPANDASVALAGYISGSEEAFARLMTRRARELGARNTRFENASGLPAEGHYSTAYDLAVLLRSAMQRPAFAGIMRLKTTTLVSEAGRIWYLRNHNRLLWTFPGMIGGKTGFTRAARRTYVGMAERGSRTLIVSVLGSADLWGDVQRLLEYGFGGVGVGETRMVLRSGTKLLASRPSPRAGPKRAAVAGGNASAYTAQPGAFRHKKHTEVLRQKRPGRGRVFRLQRRRQPEGLPTHLDCWACGDLSHAKGQ